VRTTLYTAAWVLPVSRPSIRNGAVLVDEHGRIREVGPASAVQAGDDVARIDFGEAILLPGLVNVHTHPELTAMRGLLEDLPFHLWIPRLRAAKDGAAPSEADLAACARWSCLEAVAAGITTIGATEDSGAALDAMREAGLRGTVYREVFGPDPAHAAPALARLRDRVAAMRARETDLVRVGVSPHAPYTVSDALFGAVAAFAAAEGLPLAVHAAEAEAEVHLVTAGSGPFAAGLRTRGIATSRRARSTIGLLDATGILACRPLLIHCVHVDAADMRRIADAGAAIAHCPIANARLGHGIAPVVELLELGVSVGLGTDSVASNNRMDMLEEARAAQLMQRARLASAGALPPDRLLRLATLDGAAALRIDDRTGSLEPGKDADLCAVRLDRPHTQPVHEPAAALMLSARGGDVVFTAVRGRVLFHDGRFTTLDPDALRARVADTAARMRQSADHDAPVQRVGSTAVGDTPRK
jgi:cytosine/adenosine deaminase-related metal-dependent hydrolase